MAWVRVCRLEDLASKGKMAVKAGGRSIALFYVDGRVYAIDNRCPHMGYPLVKGSVKGCILTCDWHHARFDLETGGALDLWADDAQVYRVNVKDGWVYVDLDTPQRGCHYYLRRVREALDHSITLVAAKSVLGAFSKCSGSKEIYKVVADWVDGRDYTWGGGATYIAAVANLEAMGILDPRSHALGLVRGLEVLSEEASERPPRPFMAPLGLVARERLKDLKALLRETLETRDPSAAERVLYTVSTLTESLEAVARVFMETATDHYLADGHVVDFANKAFEFMRLVGLRHGIIRGLARMLATARRYEEESAWRTPIDLVAVAEREFQRLPEAFEAGVEGGLHVGPEKVTEIVLGSDPEAIARGLTSLLLKGYHPLSIARGVAYSAAVRLAEFNSANDVEDWFSPAHALTYAHAIYRALERTPSWEVFRGVYHAALRIYLDRLLSTPPYKPPKGSSGRDSRALLKSLLETMDKRYSVDEVPGLVADYLASGGDEEELLKILAYAVLREDQDFHVVQVLEAGARLSRELSKGGWRKTVYIAVARFTASQAPTRRRVEHTLRIAEKLSHNQDLIGLS